MNMTLAALSAIVALTALTGNAAAGPRFEDHRSVVRIDDRGGDYRGRGRADYGEDRGGRRYDDVLSERRIVRSLIRRGFVSVEDIRLRRDRYIVEAVRPNGALVRLAIDAYDGEIIDRERIGWVRDRGPRGGGRGVGAEFDFGGGSLGIYSR